MFKIDGLAFYVPTLSYKIPAVIVWNVWKYIQTAHWSMSKATYVLIEVTCVLSEVTCVMSELRRVQMKIPKG